MKGRSIGRILAHFAYQDQPGDKEFPSLAATAHVHPIQSRGIRLSTLSKDTIQAKLLDFSPHYPYIFVLMLNVKQKSC